MSGVSLGTDIPISDSLVQGSVQILTAPGNPLTECIHIRTASEQGFDDFDRAIPDSELQGRISIEPRVRIRAGGNQGFDSTEVSTPDSNDQPVVEAAEAGAVSSTGRSHDDEHEDTSGERLHRVLTPSLDRIVDRPPFRESGHRELHGVR